MTDWFVYHIFATVQVCDTSLSQLLVGIQTTFNLPKLHSCRHYVDMIWTFGMTDNYNTEYTECLHIDLAKDAYIKVMNWWDAGEAEVEW